MSDRETTTRIAEQFARTIGRPAETAAILSPDASWWMVPSAGVGVVEGKEIQPFLERLFTETLDGTSMQITVDDLICNEGKAALRLQMSGKASSGQPYHNVHAMFLTVQDGRVTEVHDYPDVAHAMQQLVTDLEVARETQRVDVVGSDLVEVYTDIEIDAPHGIVWDTLTDFDHLADWSDSFVSCEGDFRAGGTIHVTFRVALGFAVNPVHEVKFFEPGRQFGWSDPLGMGMSDHHVFRVEPLANGRSRFVQTDHVQGGATHLMGRTMASQISEMYRRFNRQLKTEAERRFAQSATQRS